MDVKPNAAFGIWQLRSHWMPQGSQICQLSHRLALDQRLELVPDMFCLVFFPACGNLEGVTTCN